MQEQEAKNINEKLEYAENFLLERENYTADQLKEFKHKMSQWKTQFKQKCENSSRKLGIFETKYKSWLQGSFQIPNTRNFSPGRPTIPFAECSDRSKRRKTKDLRENVDVEELLFAAQSKLRTTGQRKAAKLMKEINEVSSTKLACNCLTKKLAVLEALSMFVEAGKIFLSLIKLYLTL